MRGLKKNKPYPIAETKNPAERPGFFILTSSALDDVPGNNSDRDSRSARHIQILLLLLDS